MATSTRLDFYCDLVAGYFIDMASYPTTSGRFRYIPYRGPGHLRVGQQFEAAGFARCSWGAPDQRAERVARRGGEYGLLLIELIGEQS
jgi:hypothetical protein